MPPSKKPPASKSASKPRNAAARKTRRTSPLLNFDSITVEGALLSSALMSRVAAQSASEQSEADYAVPKGLNLRDEIARFYRIAAALFQDFSASPTPSALAARTFTQSLLTQVLGFPAVDSDAEDFGPYSWSAQQGRVPVVLVPPSEDLDRATGLLSVDGRRRSASSTLQDWLNQREEALWGFCSNGDRLRLMRDNASLTRPAYIEVNLRQIFETDNFADFAVFWQLFHASRFGAPGSPAADCILERWREDGAREGVAARERLREGVELALELLGNGFLSHPNNAALRERLRSGALSLPLLFGEVLRLVYRLIFLMVAEDRELLHPPASPPIATRLYAEAYSLNLLRQRAIRRAAWDRHHDQWQGLLVVFAGLAQGQPKLALPALGGLFASTEIPNLEAARLSNRALLEAIYRLAWLRDEGQLLPVNWRDMETEELGSVYESLLELTPLLRDDARGMSFAEGDEAKGHQRKTTGSYYTPDSLVQTLLDSALEPVLDRFQAEAPLSNTAGDKDSEATDKAAALLKVKVIDPACGSGHFLLAAARRIATRVARLRTGGVASKTDYCQALRDVVRSCIHGVDRNPMAVELTKVALWIESVEPGKPLGFLDANILPGDSLLGIFDLEVLRQGIPDAAYKPLAGDDKDVAKHFDKRNKAERDGQGSFDFSGGASRVPAAPPLAASLQDVRRLPEDTAAQIEEKKKRLAAARTDSELWKWRVAADLYMGAFLIAKKDTPRTVNESLIPTTDHVWRTLSGGRVHGLLLQAAKELVDSAHVFHWPLEFPDIMSQGGFDLVIGNPPWERIKLQEQEFFASREPEIALAPTADIRGKKIAELKASDKGTRERNLYEEFEQAKRTSEASSVFARESGRFPLTGRGDVNTYALFAELFLQALSKRGRSGVILPSGIATDSTTAPYFSHVTQNKRLVSLIDFENRDRIFPAIDSRIKFCLFTLSGGQYSTPTYCCWLTHPSELADPRRVLQIPSSLLDQFNPNTGNAPIFRAEADRDLTRSIFQRVNVLVNEKLTQNLWRVDLKRVFDMNKSSVLELCALDQEFRTLGRKDIFAKGYLPMLEGKMISHDDHRFGTYESVAKRPKGPLPQPTEEDYSDPKYLPHPWFWIQSDKVPKPFQRQWVIGFRDIARSTDERTMIACLLPFASTDFTIRQMRTSRSPVEACCLLANLNSIVLDYVARQFVGGTHLSDFITKQLPIIEPHAYDEAAACIVVPRTVELAYTSCHLSHFVADLFQAASERLRGSIVSQWSTNRDSLNISEVEASPRPACDDQPSFNLLPIKPFMWKMARRAVMRAELDAWYARAYGLSRDELRYILDPAEVMGQDYPSETFRVLKNNEIKKFGEYRTQRLVLEAWDRLEAGDLK